MVDSFCISKKVLVWWISKDCFSKMSDESVSIDYQEDWTDTFLGKSVSDRKQLSPIGKLIFFLMIRILLEVSLLTKSWWTLTWRKNLKSKRLIYDKIGGGYLKISSFPISIELRKSCMLASQRYKQGFEKQKKKK